MFNKRKLNHDYRRIKKIRSSYILALAIFFLCLGIYGLRQNNFRMIELRDKVVATDKQDGDVETALRNLRQFVYGHMNTNLASGNVSIKPPVQLKYRYERLAKKEATRVNSANEKVKKKGKSICLKQYPDRVFNSSRVTCVANYIKTHSAKQNEVPAELYKFDFLSPAWSPDLAGISLLLSLVFFAALLVRVVAEWWYRLELK